MRRAAEEAKKAETSKRFEFTPAIIYLLLYNGAQAWGLVAHCAVPISDFGVQYLPCVQ